MNLAEARRDIVSLGPLERRITIAVDVVLAVATTVVILAWVLGKPLFYTSTAPVMSPFTAFSLLVLVLVRQGRMHDKDWPVTLNFAMTGLVLGGNVSSMVMIGLMPPGVWDSFSAVVLTSAMTSLGLVLFCLYDLAIVFRETPQSPFLLDDLLLHLALVPGGLSLLGYLLANPAYLSVHADPRVGISPLEMGFMALYAVAAVVSNPRLFLWGFLAAGRTNRLVFAGLFANQFVAPLVVALVFSTRGARGPGIELFVMLAGVVTTVSFLLLQARALRRHPA
ncbi:MAG: hypothetical protein KJ062_02150 [Thermoanaerobaculia bacterium]|nr:hypothetical protein [Thermoanaerobaculia bacterium]